MAEPDHSYVNMLAQAQQDCTTTGSSQMYDTNGTGPGLGPSSAHDKRVDPQYRACIAERVRAWKARQSGGSGG